MFLLTVNLRITTRSLFAICVATALTFSSTACSKSPAKTDGDKSGGGKTAGGHGGGNGAEVPTKSKSPAKPCEIVTKEELKTITGVDFANTSPQANITCTFSTSDGKKNLILTITRKNGKSRITSNKNFPGHQMIEGFGDEAIWVATTGYFEARKGDDSVGVTITGEFGDAATRLKYAKAIVKLMLERM